MDDWLSALLANLEPASRSRMMRQLAQELRRTQQQNIRMQRNPDGSSYEPRRVTARSKKGRIKRQMFAKLRTTKYLKTAASADSASVQFEGKVQRIVDVPDFETLLAERKAEFVALHPKDEQEAVIRTLELESEPVTKLLQENAYRELLLRQRINEAAQAVMAAYAIGSDLDQLAANYNVKRLTVTPADNDAVPPVAAVMESDEALRLRVPAAFEGLSVAGPTAAYEFHARSADGRVADASATSPAPAEVVLTVLSREGDGTAEKDLLDVVEKALNSENVRPVADRLTVRSAEIIPYRVEATIFLYPGPEAEPVMAAAKASLQKYIASQTRLGRDIRRSAIFAALHVEGVQRVELASPLADVVLNKTQAASCTQWSVTNGGTDE
ncbi:phage virion morphogenesis protein [Escherichia coli]|nr:phage virion morphogenesis protein [Escherichia coli]EFD8838989.1 phage virion morphogenesis protein [Escherichia coli]